MPEPRACVRCQTLNAADGLFCRQCGATLVAGYRPGAPPPQPPPLRSKPIGVGTGVRLFFGFALGATILVVVLTFGGCAACMAVVGLIGASGPSRAADLDPYRKNVGKTAFNKANGQEQGRIVGVDYETAGGERVKVYRIRHRGEVRTHPVEQTVVKDVPATVADP
jgi:hypothetical protein